MYREGKEEGRRKKEEGRSRGVNDSYAQAFGRSPLQEKEKPYMALDISPTLYTNDCVRT
ncbi:hypothetical protein [Okeania sp. KiyG1]|uniref:hypothetical protein n=1 Tax=Okeania sp. KiyG1 TaxID=2720165 RepID=UPI001924BBEB|nr:hypothetical protein [Okeania sp. KiyG1]